MDDKQVKEKTKNFTSNYGHYMEQHKDFGKKLGKVDEDLNLLKKEKLTELEDFDIEIYTKNINRLKNQLSEFEDKANKGQKEIETKIAQVNKRYNLTLPSTYIELINKNVFKID